MPPVTPASYSQRALALAVSDLTQQFVRYSATGLVATKSPTDVGTDSLFTITGGRVEILHIEGRVTTQLQAASRTLKLQYSPTSAVGDTDLSAASADVTGLTVGKKLSITGTLATAMSIAINELSLRQATGFVIEPGTIKVVSSATDITGVIQWQVNWRPFDVGAVLAAA